MLLKTELLAQKGQALKAKTTLNPCWLPHGLPPARPWKGSAAA